MTPSNDHMKGVIADELVLRYIRRVNDPAYTKWLFNTTISQLFNTTLSQPVPSHQPLSLVFTRSQFLQRTLGTRVAAGYLRNRKVSIETALYLLTRKGN